MTRTRYILEVETSGVYSCCDCRMSNVPLRFLPNGEAICQRCAGEEWYDVVVISDDSESEQWGAA